MTVSRKNSCFGWCAQLGALTAVMTACSSQTPVETGGQDAVQSALDDMNLEQGARVETIRYADMDDWTFLDKYHIVVSTRRDERYLISFRSRCYGLAAHTPITIESTTGTLSKFDDIVINNRITGPEYCAIEDIVKLEAREDALREDALIENGN